MEQAHWLEIVLALESRMDSIRDSGQEISTTLANAYSYAVVTAKRPDDFVVISRKGMEDEIDAKLSDESWRGISKEIQDHVVAITEDIAQSH